MRILIKGTVGSVDVIIDLDDISVIEIKPDEESMRIWHKGTGGSRTTSIYRAHTASTSWHNLLAYIRSPAFAHSIEEPIA